MTSDGQRGRAADVLLAVSGADPVAAVLSRPEYANKRFGWSNPWATVLGWETEQYGDRLIRITLRAEAWIARAIVDDSGQIAWAFADVEGNPVAIDQVLAQPERLGAVYFEDRRNMGCGTLQALGAAFREYFVHNEAMVQSWSIDTLENRQEIDTAVQTIEALALAVTTSECATYLGCWPQAVLQTWAEQSTDLPPLLLYSLGLAFPNPAYMPGPATWQTLLDALGRVPFEAPMTHDYGTVDAGN
jgi:hypothetical protein